MATKNVIVIQKVEEVLNAYKSINNYCGYIYEGEEMVPEVRELLLFTSQTNEFHKVIGFHKNITDSEEFKEMVDYYHIDLDDIKLFEFDVNPLKLYPEQRLEFSRKLRGILNSVEPHVVREEIIPDFKISNHVENAKSFKDGLRAMFDRKRKF